MRESRRLTLAIDHVTAFRDAYSALRQVQNRFNNPLSSLSFQLSGAAALGALGVKAPPVTTSLSAARSQTARAAGRVATIATLTTFDLTPIQRWYSPEFDADDVWECVDLVLGELEARRDDAQIEEGSLAGRMANIVGFPGEVRDLLRRRRAEPVDLDQVPAPRVLDTKGGKGAVITAVVAVVGLVAALIKAFT